MSRSIPPYKQRIAGKSIPVEKFVIAKSERCLEGARLPLCGLVRGRGGESEGPGNPCERGAWGEERARDQETLVRGERGGRRERGTGEPLWEWGQKGY